MVATLISKTFSGLLNVAISVKHISGKNPLNPIRCSLDPKMLYYAHWQFYRNEEKTDCRVNEL
jgi:hypothetical protein